MAHGEPLVSAVVPAFDAGRTIERTVRSLLAQTLDRVEVIVVDDGSRDDTADRVERLAREDDRVILLRQENAGVAAARNAGIAIARAPLLAPVDADDLWLPEAAERLARALEREPLAAVAYAWSIVIDGDDRPTGLFRAATIEGDVHATIVAHNFLGNASCTLIRRACLDGSMAYDPGFRGASVEGCEDWDLYARLAARHPFVVVPEFLVAYRKATGRMSSNAERMWDSQARMLAAAAERGPPLRPWVARLSRSSYALYIAQDGPSVRREWLWRALRSAPFATLARPALWASWLRSWLPRRANASTPRLASLGDFRAPRWRLRAMLVGQDLAHAWISRFGRGGGQVAK